VSPRFRILGVTGSFPRHSVSATKQGARRSRLRANQRTCARWVRAATTCRRGSYADFRNARSGGRLVL